MFLHYVLTRQAAFKLHQLRLLGKEREDNKRVPLLSLSILMKGDSPDESGVLFYSLTLI